MEINSAGTAKPVLGGLLLGELREVLKSHPPFRSDQVFKGILSGAGSFDDLSNLPLSLRRELSEKYQFVSGRVTSLMEDQGTIKLAIKLEDQTIIESVMLRDGKNRKTACISTQAGCPAACVFCKTGSLGFKRNLLSAEIAGQYLHLRRSHGEKSHEISHIVIMGMGEPLLNLAELRKALVYFMDPRGFNISKRRITLSSCGIIDGIYDFCESGPDIRLAISLVSARQELRDSLMPISRGNPLPLLKEALRAYQKKRKHRITLEIVLLGGINTGAEEAEALAAFAQGLDTVINIIPWNTVEGLEHDNKALRAPSAREIGRFISLLEGRKLKVTRRFEKGSAIQGACGQLGSLQAGLP